MDASVWTCAYGCRWQWRPEEGAGTPEAGVTSDCELTWVLGIKLATLQEQCAFLAPELFSPAQALLYF